MIHLSDFSIQTNLTIARDRVLGVLLGITIMWLVFERLLSRSAADEMVRIFVANLRLLADLFSSTPRADDRAGISRSGASAMPSIATSAKSIPNPTPSPSKPGLCAQGIWRLATASGDGRLRCAVFISSKHHSCSSAFSPRTI